MSQADRAKQLLHRALRRAGLTVRRYSPATVPDDQVRALLAHHDIDLVVDVGANGGHYAMSLRRAGYLGRILSFEPLQDAWTRCMANAHADQLWSVAPRMALGAAERPVEIHVASNSVSSSILPMEEIHRQAAPGSAYVGSEVVEMRRLDWGRRAEIEAARHPFLKIDTQGYEREVLEGATDVLGRFSGVQLEMSLVPAVRKGSPTLAPSCC